MPARCHVAAALLRSSNGICRSSASNIATACSKTIGAQTGLALVMTMSGGIPWCRTVPYPAVASASQRVRRLGAARARAIAAS
jgi:hypothetical protein